MIELTEYTGDQPGRPMFLDPAAIECVRSFCRRTCRPQFEIVLRGGATVRVWEDAEHVRKLVERATGERPASGEWPIVSVDFDPEEFPGCTTIVVQGSLPGVGSGDRVIIRKAKEAAGQ